MDNVQKHNICINVPSSQTFRNILLFVLKLKCVFCEVETDFFSFIYLNFVHRRNNAVCFL
jgi:hypothetical protein